MRGPGRFIDRLFVNRLGGERGGSGYKGRPDGLRSCCLRDGWSQFRCSFAQPEWSVAEFRILWVEGVLLTEATHKLPPFGASITHRESPTKITYSNRPAISPTADASGTYRFAPGVSNESRPVRGQ